MAAPATPVTVQPLKKMELWPVTAKTTEKLSQKAIVVAEITQAVNPITL